MLLCVCLKYSMFESACMWSTCTFMNSVEMSLAYKCAYYRHPPPPPLLFLSSICVAVGSMVMEGLPHSGRTTTLVTSLVGGASDATSQLVDLKLDINPIDRPEMDVTVKAALFRPIQIIYDFVRLVADLLPGIFVFPQKIVSKIVK